MLFEGGEFLFAFPQILVKSAQSHYFTADVDVLTIRVNRNVLHFTKDLRE